MSEWEDRTGNYFPKVLFTLDAVLHDLERNIFSCGQTSLSRGAFYRMAVSFSLLLFPRGAVDRTVVPFSGPTSAIACELREKKPAGHRTVHMIKMFYVEVDIVIH